MHYFIDGYNLMFSILSVEETLQSDRQEIISDLNEKIQLLQLDATLIFDGHFRYGLGSRSHIAQLEIRFTDHGESADDCIVRELERAAKPKNITVVTSDNRLAWRSRQRGAKTVSIRKFLFWLNSQFKKKGLSSKKISPPKPEPLPHHEFTVTDETSEYYLLEFEKRFKETYKDDKPLREKPVSEIDRWEKLFNDRLEQSEDNS